MNTISIEQVNTFGDWAYLAVSKHFAKILKHEAGVLKDKEPEELHQMRVGMRRLRSAITGFASALDLPPDATQKKVGKIARVLGELRDLDVLEDTLKNNYQPILPTKEQKHLDKALKVLAKKRKKAFKKVKNILNDDLYLDLKIGLQEWLEEPNYQEIATISINEVLPDLLLPQISKLLLHPGWLVGVKSEAGKMKLPQNLSKEEVEELLDTEGYELHELRKEAKRSRYQMELFTQFYGEEYQEYLQQVKEIQTVLGDIQDSYVLTEFLTGVFDSDLKKKMPNLTALLTESCHQKWLEWEKIQQKFLDYQTRQNFHITVLHPTIKTATDRENIEEKETTENSKNGENIEEEKTRENQTNGLNIEEEKTRENQENGLNFKEIVPEKPEKNGNTVQLDKNEHWKRWYYINLTRGTS